MGQGPRTVSDETVPDAVDQIEAAIDSLPPADVPPALRARGRLYWVRRASNPACGLGSGLIISLVDLATLVRQHDEGTAKFDEDILASMLDPGIERVLRVGFALVLKKVQGVSFPGSDKTADPGDAFDSYCGIWDKAGDFGQKIKEDFEQLITEDTAAGRKRSAEKLAGKAGFTSRGVLEDLKKFADGATRTLGPPFLQKLEQTCKEGK